MTSFKYRLFNHTSDPSDYKKVQPDVTLLTSCQQMKNQISHRKDQELEEENRKLKHSLGEFHKEKEALSEMVMKLRERVLDLELELEEVLHTNPHAFSDSNEHSEYDKLLNAYQQEQRANYRLKLDLQLLKRKIERAQAKEGSTQQKNGYQTLNEVNLRLSRLLTQLKSRN